MKQQELITLYEDVHEGASLLVLQNQFRLKYLEEFKSSEVCLFYASPVQPLFHLRFIRELVGVMT